MDEKSEEKGFYASGNVSVTNARFRVGSTTYAMQGVTSVKKHQVPANKKIPVIMAIVGLAMLFAESISVKGIGLVLFIIAIFLFTKLKDTFIVVLNSSSGEKQALESNNENYINDVINALNDSIVYRG